jgi:ribonuclease HII
MIIPTTTLEQAFWKKGFLHVAGVDEAGKGPLAGPVSAAAVIIHQKQQIVKTVRDSKLMTEKQRAKAFYEICRKSSAFGVGIVSNREIDLLGIEKAVQKAMILSLQQIEKKYKLTISFVLVDGSKTLPLPHYASKRIMKGGLYHYSIAAASILAKVTRDRIMQKAAIQYPQYGFSHHVGYGTKFHFEALSKFGVCPLHRKTYAPIKTMLVS